MLRDSVHTEQDFLKSRMWTHGSLHISNVITCETKMPVSDQAWWRREKAKRRSKRWDTGAPLWNCVATVHYLAAIPSFCSFHLVPPLIPSHLIFSVFRFFQQQLEQRLYLFSKDGFILLLDAHLMTGRKQEISLEGTCNYAFLFL